MDTPPNNVKQLLVKIAENDDKQAFNIFFKYYYPKLIRFALLFVPHYEQAEDIISNVLTKMLKNRQKTFKMTNFEGYIFRAVKNESLNHLKREKQYYNINPIDEERDFISKSFTDPLEKLIEDELRTVIAKAVESLSPKRRMVYKLIKDEGLKYKEVAELLDISERTVEVHLKLSITTLKTVINEYIESKDTETSKIYLKVAKSLIIPILLSLQI